MTFQCPRCGGPYFGRHYALTNPRLVHCHCDTNGNAASAVPGNVTQKKDYCGWKGDESECGLGMPEPFENSVVNQNLDSMSDN